MPRWLRQFLERGNLKTHLFCALAIGLFLRLLSAYFVYGPQALDDYKHGVWPAYQFFAGLPLDIPNYRSHLLVWFLGGFVHVGSWFGIESALGQVRAMYMGLALTSLLGIYGTYLYVQTFRSKLFSRLALYFIAAFPLMPFASTRAFGEAVAMSLILLSLGWLERARRTQAEDLGVWIAGFALLGLAVHFRFHVGLIYFSYAVLVLRSKNRPAIIGALIGGVLTLIGQAGIDLASGKAAFETLKVYLAENDGGGARYGVSPWYNPWLFVLATGLAPFSFTLWRSLKGLWERHRFIVVPFLVFVAAHSVTAHKEERFLYPVLGLELWILAYLWSASSFNKYARRVFSPVLIVVTILLLPVACFVNTQEGEIEPPALIEKRYRHAIYLDHQSLFGKSRFQFYFLRPPSQLRMVEPTDFSAHRIDEDLSATPGAKALVMLTSMPEVRLQLDALAGIHTLEARCLDVRESGSFIDRLIYKMNPERNQRRRPTWYLICERSRNA